MTTLASDDIQTIISDYLSGEVMCDASGPSLTVCAMPLEYPSGDSITVWVEQLGDTFRVSDYGESFVDIVASKRRDFRTIHRAAAAIGRRWGVELKDGLLVAQTKRDELADTVWRVAMVAARVAQATLRENAPHAQHERERYFVLEVEQELRKRNLRIERGARIPGYSGHLYKATFYVPAATAILEPVNTPGHYNQISSVYMKFGDIAHADGDNGRTHRRLSLVDDRGGSLSRDLASLLVQVSSLVAWTRRDEWIDVLTT
jgi:hypothetical protein